MTHSEGGFKPEMESIVCGKTGRGPFFRKFQMPVAGCGVVGPCGPRAGNSSGVCPGNSSGPSGSPGSCTGGRISGLDFQVGSPTEARMAVRFDGWIFGRVDRHSVVISVQRSLKGQRSRQMDVPLEPAR
jgi:hypothetical protein